MGVARCLREAVPVGRVGGFGRGLSGSVVAANDVITMLLQQIEGGHDSVVLPADNIGAGRGGGVSTDVVVVPMQAVDVNEPLPLGEFAARRC